MSEEKPSKAPAGQHYHGPKGLLFVPRGKEKDPKYVELLKDAKPVTMDGNRIVR